LPGNDADIEMAPQLTCLYLPPNGSRFVGPGKDELCAETMAIFFPTFRAVRLLPSPATMTSFTTAIFHADRSILLTALLTAQDARVGTMQDFID
jgi:hypothetical protein